MGASYQDWLEYVFERPQTPRGWYFDLEWGDFDATPEEVTKLVAITMRRSGADLEQFSDRQVNEGLHFIFNNACGDIVFKLIDEKVPDAVRLDAIDSLRWLYSDCLEKRCAPVLGHLDEPGATPLNSICYMLWDITPLHYKKSPEPILAVMEAALTGRNDACIEGALHGLGHSRSYAPDGRVEGIIRKFLERRKDLRPELVRYAEAACTGCIL